MAVPTIIASVVRVEEAPGHGADIVEESESGFGSRVVNGVRLGEKLQVGVDLLG